MIHHDIYIYISWYAKNGFWGGPTLFRQTSPCISIEGCQLQPTAGLQKGMVSAWQRYWSDSHADQPQTGTSADVKTVPVKMVPEPRLYPFSLIDVLLILSIRLQLAVFLLAVCLGLPWAGDWMWVIAQGSETDFGIFGRFFVLIIQSQAFSIGPNPYLERHLCNQLHDLIRQGSGSAWLLPVLDALWPKLLPRQRKKQCV